MYNVELALPKVYYNIRLLAGTGGQGNLDHTTGTSATFNGPWGITTDGTYLYVTEDSHLIRRIE